ncbi:MAG TPA: cyclase family protein [Bryobacteraceae bacterium]|jgi:kynurenine formamidase
MSEKLSNLLSLTSSSKLIDLSQPWFVGMPHHPAHPPFLFSLNKKHGDYIGPGGVSSASESLALGGHVGTHIDALCHFSCGGNLHGGQPAAGIQSYGGGIQALTIDTVQPILRRGVFLDIAGLQGNQPLPTDFEITPDLLDRAASRQSVSISPGDVVLLRTGWAQYWEDAPRFISEVHGPGPSIAGARWLSSRGVFAGGSDTVAFEKVPDPAMPVHVHLLVESGIHIIECLNLEALAAQKIYEFLFVASPLKIRGGTGSPMRPFAVIPE